MAADLHADLHVVGQTGDGCRILRDPCGGYLVHSTHGTGPERRAANLPSAYALCELLHTRSLLVLPRRLGG